MVWTLDFTPKKWSQSRRKDLIYILRPLLLLCVLEDCNTNREIYFELESTGLTDGLKVGSEKK